MQSEGEREFQRGVSDARADVSSGKCRFFCQARGSWGDRFVELMRDRFDVQVVRTSDMTWETKKRYEEGYNATIEAHLNETFGAGMLKRTWEEVQEYRLEAYRRWCASQGNT